MSTKWLPLADLLRDWRPGSQGDDWTWEQESADLFTDEHRAYTLALADDLSLNPQHESVLLGTDGRVWDGHHRIIAALYLGLDGLRVEYAADLVGTESR